MENEKVILKSISFLEKIDSFVLGVYYLYDNNKTLVYIGKSKNIKRRIREHINKGTKLSKNIQYFRFKKTNNELFGLLLESSEIKRYRPIFNKKLRRKNNLNYFLSYTKNKDGIYYLHSSIKPQFSLKNFSSIKALNKYIDNFLTTNNLCHEINLNKTNKRLCFNYHLKKCIGICANTKLRSEYNDKFKKALDVVVFNKINKIEIFFEKNCCGTAYFQDYFITRFDSFNQSIEFNYKTHDETNILMGYIKNNALNFVIK